MMNIRIFPYKMGSDSAKKLQAALQERGASCLRVNKNSETYRLQDNHKLINWGCSGIPVIEWRAQEVLLNRFDCVRNASHKLRAFELLECAGVSVPEFTTSSHPAYVWVAGGSTLVCREVLTGHSGEGINLYTYEDSVNDNALPAVPLYTKYQKKTHEYRVHILPNGNGIINQKRRRLDVPDDEVNWQVRNHANGFIYSRDNVEHHDGLLPLARKAVDALGLDFGAVDIIYHKPTETMMVLEVNCAPGLSGSLINEYADAFMEVFNG